MNSRFIRPPPSRYSDQPRYYQPLRSENIERVVKDVDIITFKNQRYDRSVLARLMGTYPLMSIADNPAVANIVVNDAVPRYPNMSDKPNRGYAQLVMVDMDLKPILAPEGFDPKVPLTLVALVNKHSLKRALIDA